MPAGATVSLVTVHREGLAPTANTRPAGSHSVCVCVCYTPTQAHTTCTPQTTTTTARAYTLLWPTLCPYRMVLSVRNRIQFGSGRFCLALRPRMRFTLNDLCDG
jgi:hypothetical protein